MENPDRNQPLPFLVLVTKREMRPMEGHDEPSGPLCFLRAIPGNVIAWDRTEERAWENLMMKIEGDCFGGARAWYGRQLGQLDADRALSVYAKRLFRHFVGDPWSYELRDGSIMGVPVRFAVVEVADEVMFPAGLDLPGDPS